MMNQKMRFNRICTTCKRHIEVNRGQETDAVLFDGKVYHTGCFLATKAVVKKCAYCGKNITIQTESDFSDVARLGTKFYHKGCFLKNCSEKKASQWKHIAENVDVYISDAKINICAVADKKIKALNDIDKLKYNFQQNVADKYFAESDLIAFIRERYDITNLPTRVYSTIKAITGGTYKNNTVCIPIEELYDMWQRKFDYLNEVYLMNRAKGKDMDGCARINYDLAILANKYDSYVKWKRKQEVQEQETIQNVQTCQKDNQISKVLEAYSKHASVANKSDDADDIDDLLNDDLY